MDRGVPAVDAERALCGVVAGAVRAVGVRVAGGAAAPAPAPVAPPVALPLPDAGRGEVVAARVSAVAGFAGVAAGFVEDVAAAPPAAGFVVVAVEGLVVVVAVFAAVAAGFVAVVVGLDVVVAGFVAAAGAFPFEAGAGFFALAFLILSARILSAFALAAALCPCASGAMPSANVVLQSTTRNAVVRGLRRSIVRPWEARIDEEPLTRDGLGRWSRLHQ